jgi:hypothetical protein
LAVRTAAGRIESAVVDTAADIAVDIVVGTVAVAAV